MRIQYILVFGKFDFVNICNYCVICLIIADNNSQKRLHFYVAYRAHSEVVELYKGW